MICHQYLILCADDRPTVAAQVPAAAAHRGGDGGGRGGHEQRGQDADLHLPGEPVHRRHRLPKHRRKIEHHFIIIMTIMGLI